MNYGKINILGTEYNIKFKEESEDLMLKNYGGYCDWTVREIIVCKIEEQFDSYKDIERVEKENLRHEIIHAFLNESGLKANSDWARNEEMVDWFAIQFHKIKKVFEELEC